jgi:hypothetical protein
MPANRSGAPFSSFFAATMDTYLQRDGVEMNAAQ